MKRIILLFFLVICLFCLCSCEKKNYDVIELTSGELLNHLLKEDSSITFATFNTDKSKNNEFLENLKKVCKMAKQNVYVIDSNHIASGDNLILYEILGEDIKELKYYVLQNGKFIVQKEYMDFDTMYKELNGKKYKETPELLSESEKQEYIDKANESYEKGLISQAYDGLSMAWSSEDAKKTFENNNLYNLINEWESYEVDKTGTKLTYTRVMFFSFSNTMYFTTKTDLIDGFEKPTLDEYEMLYYYVQDGYIYTSEDGKEYKKNYLIEYLDKEYFNMKKGNKTYKFFALKEE